MAKTTYVWINKQSGFLHKKVDDAIWHAKVNVSLKAKKEREDVTVDKINESIYHVYICYYDENNNHQISSNWVHKEQVF